MAAININNGTNNNGYNYLYPASTLAADKDQAILQSGRGISRMNNVPMHMQQSAQQVNVYNFGTTTSHMIPSQPHRNVVKMNLINNNHQYMHHHHHSKSRMSDFDHISIKSKIGVEFRRYALKKEDVLSFNSFYKKIESFHQLSAIPFVIFYTDSEDSLLPINNDDNLAKAIQSAKRLTLQQTNYNNNLPSTMKRPFLKIFIEKRGMHLDYYYGNTSGKYKKNQKGFSNFILSTNEQGLRPSISMPEHFRQVSSIIDVDIVPETCRRVRIVKHGSDRPLGFYIRDGTYKIMNAHGQIEIVTGIFISRLVPGGLAESTGLLAVNDEVLEVNGIRVTNGKTLDQVTDMMVANSSNLIITIRPGKMNSIER